MSKTFEDFCYDCVTNGQAFDYAWFRYQFKTMNKHVTEHREFTKLTSYINFILNTKNTKPFIKDEAEGYLSPSLYGYVVRGTANDGQDVYFNLDRVLEIKQALEDEGYE